MKPASLPQLLGAVLATAAAVSAITIAEINGDRFNSPLDGQSVKNVTGLVTAIDDKGVYLRSLQPDSNPATAESLFVFGSSVIDKVSVGDVVSIDGKVDKFRYSLTAKRKR